jgi:hypothetical protein
MDFNTPLIALATLLIGGMVVGVAVLASLRGSVDYMLARGNPRNRGQAHETYVDIIKGLALAAFTIGGAALVATTLGVH